MIVDAYKHFKDHPKYNKLVGNDFLLVEYKCPLKSEEFKLWTESHFITYVISGRKDWTTLNKTYTVEKGEALFIKKGVYSTKQYFKVDYCVMLFFFTDDFIRRFLKENTNYSSSKNDVLPDKQIFNIDVNDTLESLFNTVFNYLKQLQAIPKDLVEIKFKELLYNIILNPKNNNLVQFFSSLEKVDKTNLDHIMMKNFHNDLKLEEFARLSGRSLSTFKRDFKNYYNETPGKWLNNKRLELAKTLLQTSDLNVNEVCYESGFTNTSHFNKVFKEKFKSPPKQYRILHSNN